MTALAEVSAAISAWLTASHPNSEVKQVRAGVVLRWGTTREGPVLRFFFFLFSLFFFRFSSIFVFAFPFLFLFRTRLLSRFLLLRAPLPPRVSYRTGR